MKKNLRTCAAPPSRGVFGYAIFFSKSHPRITGKSDGLFGERGETIFPTLNKRFDLIEELVVGTYEGQVVVQTVAGHTTQPVLQSFNLDQISPNFRFHGGDLME